MKFYSPILFLAIVSLISNSCTKETSQEGLGKPPVANAGSDKTIALPVDSVLLDGSASTDPDGTINEWKWAKISGPVSFTFSDAATSKPITKNLQAGIYHFELSVKDNGGLSAKDTVQVIVIDPTQPNQPPIANAGADQVITLPINTVNFNGGGSTDPDNNISGYLWRKISGPSPFNITNANASQSQVINLGQGIYMFELKVTDAGGLFDNDTILVFVNPGITNQSDSVNVIFYCPDFTGSLPVFNDTIPGTSELPQWVSWVGPNYINLITVKLPSLSLTDSLDGVWCSNGCAPTCSIVMHPYFPYEKYIVSFKLPPGTYTWSAESSTNIPNLLGATPEFMNFFQTPHSTGGTFTVTAPPSGTSNSCLTIPIVF